MYRLRRAGERGHFNHGWLDTYHTFSFGDYYDPDFTQFRSLRIMNEDRVQPSAGFGMHGHRDMEIVTYVLSGQLEHRDSLGHGEILRPGELQRMSAGTGIRHSEFNPSTDEAVHLYQIWLLPDRNGREPSYEQKPLDPQEKRNRLQVVASPDAANGLLTIHQDARISLADLDEGVSLTQSIADGRHTWLQVLRGRMAVGGKTLEAGDGLAISDEREVSVKAVQAGEVMLFDLA